MAVLRSSRLLAAFLVLSSLGGASLGGASRADAQATCVDATGDACLNVIRTARADGVVEDIFTTRDGLYAPQLGFATYVRGVNGCIGQTHTPTILSGYTCGAAGSNPPGGNDPAFQANSLDWYWTQVVRTDDSGAAVADGLPGFYIPWRGRIYDLGGEANRVVLFPITDHAPLPCEAFEYTVWLSNNPDATTIAPPSAPDPSQWNEARLIRTFTQGWTRNPAATGVAEATRADLGTWLRDTTAGEAVADALATVWALPCGLSFRYVAMQAGNNGNPGPECVFHSSDDELDAVAGLNEDDIDLHRRRWRWPPRRELRRRGLRRHQPGHPPGRVRALQRHHRLRLPARRSLPDRHHVRHGHRSLRDHVLRGCVRGRLHLQREQRLPRGLLRHAHRALPRRNPLPRRELRRALRRSGLPPWPHLRGRRVHRSLRGRGLPFDAGLHRGRPRRADGLRTGVHLLGSGGLGDLRPRSSVRCARGLAHHRPLRGPGL